MLRVRCLMPCSLTLALGWWEADVEEDGDEDDDDYEGKPLFCPLLLFALSRFLYAHFHTHERSSCFSRRVSLFLLSRLCRVEAGS